MTKGSPSEDRPSPSQGREYSRSRTQAQMLSKKKVFKFFFQAISKKKQKKGLQSDPQNFNDLKNRAVLEPRNGQFLRT